MKKTNLSESKTFLDIFGLVGLSVSQWEVAELYLAEIFAALCESRSYAAFRAYGTVLSSTTKKEMIEAAAAEFFRRTPNSATFKRLIDQLNLVSQMIGKRNGLAHACVLPAFKKGKDQLALFTLPNHTRKHKRNKPPPPVWADDVRKIQGDLACFAIELMALRDEIVTLSEKRLLRRERKRPQRSRPGTAKRQA